MEVLTTIYSQPSIEALRELVNTFFNVFEIEDKTFDDMFYYGVFCAPETYANNDWESLLGYNNFDIPQNIYAVCSTSQERVNYVNMIIDEVIKGEIEKPDWMTYVEMETSCNEYDQQPSNFLRLIPKDEKYKELGEKIISFLYSPNRTTVVY